jgi:hypothetical protein
MRLGFLPWGRGRFNHEGHEEREGRAGRIGDRVGLAKFVFSANNFFFVG